VDWEAWGEEGGGMTFGDDEGWEDDEQRLRCAECPEGVFCEAGVGVKGVSDGEEILATCQEEEYAEFSDGDGDFECDEETRVQANIRTETGMRLAVLDSAATIVWFDEETFAECNGRDLEPATRGAGGGRMGAC
jgi:hypothetical protein